MTFAPVIFLAATLTAGSLVHAQPSAQDEVIRLENLKRATSMEEVMDNMTPDEIAAVMGVPSGEQFTQWLQNNPELMFQNVSSILVDIRVSLAQQKIYVAYPGGQWADKVSSGMNEFSPGARGYRSKRGCFTPYSLEQMHYSKKYDYTPMPNSLFYFGGYAIHATAAEGRLGRPASHGCVRVSHETSQYIYNIVSKFGRKNTRVCVCWNDCSELAAQ